MSESSSVLETNGFSLQTRYGSILAPGSGGSSNSSSSSSSSLACFFNTEYRYFLNFGLATEVMDYESNVLCCTEKLEGGSLEYVSD